MAKNEPPKTFKRHPMPDNEERRQLIENFARDIKGQPDMVCALVAAAYMESVLVTMLSEFFVKCDTSKEVLNGTLGDLFKCAQIARCLGFINGPMLNNLKKITDIRNFFAHDRKSCHMSFNSGEVKDLCISLTLPKGMTEEDEVKGITDNGITLAQYKNDPSLRFRKVSSELLWWLAARADDAQQKPVTQLVKHGFDAIW